MIKLRLFTHKGLEVEEWLHDTKPMIDGLYGWELWLVWCIKPVESTTIQGRRNWMVKQRVSFDNPEALVTARQLIENEFDKIHRLESIAG